MNLHPKSVSDIDWNLLENSNKHFPSPADWKEEILYFLLVDRFSDGREFGGFRDNEGSPVEKSSDRRTPLFQTQDRGSAEKETWFEAGKRWCGGTFQGLRDKLGYLSRLGVTALWLSPVMRQVKGSESYHGYGVQNFLDVDPHFGTMSELKSFVEESHRLGIRIILDIVLNHSGDVFAYQEPVDYSGGTQWPVKGFRRHAGDRGTLPFGPLEDDAWPDQGVWPREFQRPRVWSRKGPINNWDSFPEFLEGDFLSLKNIDLGRGPRDQEAFDGFERRVEQFRPTDVFQDMVDVYKYWLAFLDIDGFRLDSVKHMEPGAIHRFCVDIDSYAKELGKENFFILGEVTTRRYQALDLVHTTGLDAALGVLEVSGKMEALAKGEARPGPPDGLFQLFDSGPYTHRPDSWGCSNVVTMFDDHDQTWKRRKSRFCGDGSSTEKLKMALSLNLTLVGVPCIYYGTEQAFNGSDDREGGIDDFGDVFLRECMFGGSFGSYRSEERHFFNEEHEVYRYLSELCDFRRKHPALQRGRQYLRPISEDGQNFSFPKPLNGRMESIVAWSRILDDQEYLCAMNTDESSQRSFLVTVDAELNRERESMTCLFCSQAEEKGAKVPLEQANGRAVRLTLAPSSFVVYR